MTEIIEIRRFEPHIVDELVLEQDELMGVFIDTEATGKDATVDMLTELALVRFGFSPDGKIGAVERARVYLDDPGRPISKEASEKSGITDDMVRGKRLPESEISELVHGAAIVIAHNAEFDRQVVERRGLGVFRSLSWACSYVDVPWKKEYDCSKLSCLMWQHARCFYDAHRADIDAYAGVALLGTTVPRHDGKRALSYLLESAKTTRARICAIGAGFSVKEDLKDRGYKALYERGKFQYWYRDVAVGDEYAEERRWCEEMGISGAVSKPFTSRTRFSARIGTLEGSQKAAVA